MDKNECPIDEKFFQHYAGTRQAYSKVYKQHGYSDECIALFQSEDAPKIKNICILGAATGPVVKDFHKAFGVYPYGCEINTWAWKQIPKSYCRILNLDMREYLPMAQEEGLHFDLVFSNSFVYLPESDIESILQTLSKLTKYIHFRCSFEGSACPDPYRKTLKPLEWWDQKFLIAGFKHCKTVFGNPTYLWAI